MSYPNSRHLRTFCRDLTNVENYAFSVSIFYPEIFSRVKFLTNLKSECKGLILPEESYGSDIEGPKPIFFDVGEDARMVEKALKYCLKHLGNNVTILYDSNLPGSIEKIVKEQGKEEGGLWDCYHANYFYGWEAERVLAVSRGGFNIMELITRARTHLALILDVDVGVDVYAETKNHFQQAGSKGLADIVHLNAN